MFASVRNKLCTRMLYIFGNAVTSALTFTVNLCHFALYQGLSILVKKKYFTVRFSSYAECYGDKVALLNKNKK